MAIEALDLAIRTLPGPIYVYHEIVHNKYVVEQFRSQGVVFVDELGEVPEGAVDRDAAYFMSFSQDAEERAAFDESSEFKTTGMMLGGTLRRPAFIDLKKMQSRPKMMKNARSRLLVRLSVMLSSMAA